MDVSYELMERTREFFSILCYESDVSKHTLWFVPLEVGGGHLFTLVDSRRIAAIYWLLSDIM